MSSNNNIFPSVKKTISDFLYEEEANISRGKILSIGSLMIIVSILLMTEDVFAGHRSHSSHSSHRSHSSHSSHTSSTHASHASSSTGGSYVAPTPTPTPEPVLPDTQVPQVPQATPAVE